MKKLIALLVLFCILITVIPFSVYAESTPEIPLEEFTEELSDMQEEYEDEPVSNRLIVKSKYDINELDSVDIVEGYDDLHIVQFDNPDSAGEALEYYESSKLVEYAEEDISVSTFEAEPSNGINYGNHLSWGSESIGVDDYTDYLGNINELPEIIVGIIDTGIDIDHDFLKDRIIETGFNLSDSGTADSEDDDNGHGTHVAGIIADNTTDNVKIKSFKCLNDKGSGNLSDIAIAVEAAVENEVDVINMSLGGFGKSDVLEDTINSAINKGITVCVSAGNSGIDCSKVTPANIENCITVAAIGQDYARPYWSNWGKGIDIIAPGVSINSSYLDNSYTNLSGTSMASPFVAASVALLLSKSPNMTLEEICSTLEESGINNWNPSSSADSTYYYSKPILYIGTVSIYEQERTSNPKFNLDSGNYTDRISLEITCDEAADIYYTLDGSRASKEDGIRYTQPIIIDSITRVHAIAIAPNKIKSLQVVADYYMTSTDSESNFEIDEKGIITAYSGNNDYLAIPERINGISVTGIGNDVFRGSSIVMIKLPDSVVSVGDRAFRNCKSLFTFDCKNLKSVGEYAFYNCQVLTQINLSNLESVSDYGFYTCQSIPECYNDKITVIEKYAFARWSSAVNICLPNVTRVEMNGLCLNLRMNELSLPNVEYLGRSALKGAYLIQSINLQNLKELDSKGYQFQNMASLKELYLPNLEGEFPQESIPGTNITNLILNKVSSLNETALDSATCLEKIFIPNAISIRCSTRYFDTPNLRILFAPSAETIISMPNTNNAVIYLSNRFESTSTEKIHQYTIVAPQNSYAAQWAAENGCNFIDSDSMANELGGSIRISDSGLRFGFSWDNIAEFESIADSIEYGFLYEYGETTELNRKIVANNRIDHDGYTTFNLVFTNIPKADYDTQISARAYVCIDGMYFYSDIKTRSFECVANAVLADETMDEATKEQVRSILEA